MTHRRPSPSRRFDYEIFGANPALAGVPAEAGSYDVFNGALLEFYDAYNVELYSLAQSQC